MTMLTFRIVVYNFNIAGSKVRTLHFHVQYTIAYVSEFNRLLVSKLFMITIDILEFCVTQYYYSAAKKISMVLHSLKCKCTFKVAVWGENFSLNGIQTLCFNYV